MRAFSDSLKREDGIIEMNDSCWETEWHDFITTLRNFGAVYEHPDDDMTCEGTIGLRAVSEMAFEDEGAAIAWCIHQ